MMTIQIYVEFLHPKIIAKPSFSSFSQQVRVSLRQMLSGALTHPPFGVITLPLSHTAM